MKPSNDLLCRARQNGLGDLRALGDHGPVIPTAAGEFRQSWRIVIAGWIGAIFGFNGFAYASFSVLVDPLAHALGQSIPAISGWVTCYFLGNTAASPFVGMLADRMGARRIILWAIPGFALSWALAGTFGSALWCLYALAFCAGSIGAGASPLTYSRTINTWFAAGRGTALGIMSSGIGLSYLFGPLLVQRTADAYGWRMGFLLIAVANLLPLILNLKWLHEKREVTPGYASAPGGRAPLSVGQQPSAAGVSKARESGDTLGEAMRRAVFWYLCAALIGYAISAGGVTVNLVAFLSASGMTRGAAASYVGLLGIFSLAGRVITGVIIDRLHVASVCGALLVLEAIAFCLLGHFLAQWAWLAIPLTGFAFGGEVSCVGYLVSRYFGIKHFGAIIGMLTLMSSIGVAIGPPFFGLLRQHSGTYAFPFFVAAGIALASAACFGAIKFFPFFQASE